jgi:hypothetical protein
MAESIDEVRGMMRCVGRSPGADRIELTEDVAERSGSAAPGGLGELLLLGLLAISATSALVISGNWATGWAELEGGTGNGAFTMREMGDRFWEGDALTLDLGESGLWEEGDSS